MGKPTGFKEFPRKAVPYREPLAAAGRLSARSSRIRRRSICSTQGARCMDCGVPFCQSGDRLPDRQPDSRVERPGLSGPLARCARPAAQDEQLSRSSPAAPAPRRAKGPACSASPIRRSRSRTSRTRSSTAASPKAGSCPSRRRRAPARRSRSSAPGPSGLAAAAQLNKAGHTRHRLRAGRPHRRPADVRHSEHEARQGRRRAAGQPAPRGRGRVRHQRRRRQQANRRTSSIRRSCSTRTTPLLLATGATQAERPADSRPRPGRHPLRDGVPHGEHQEPARQQARRTASTSAPRTRM